MPSKFRIFGRPLFRDAASFFHFAISLVCIIAFFYINLYSLPLGVTTVQSATEMAGELGGIEIGIYGEIEATGDADFILHDESTNSSILAVCVGGAPIPSEGSVVVATGKIFYDGSQTVLMCESVDPVAENTVAFDNPWTLPIIRVFAASIIWFIGMATVSGLFSIIYMARHNIRIENRMVAFSELAFLSGLITITLIFFLSRSEGESISSLSTLSIPIIVSISLVALSLVLSISQSLELSEFAKALPFIAVMAIIIGLPISILQLDVIYFDYLSEAITENILISPVSIALGAIGFIMFAYYLSNRRYEIISAGALVEHMRSEVRRY